MKFLFTCGGTAGHINPAIAVASRLQELVPGAEVLFIGAEGMMETDLVPREGYAIQSIRVTNLSRELSLQGLRHNLNTIHNVFVSSAEARKMIRAFAPDVVIGTGGYVCFPVLTAAHELHIPTVIHESNAEPGLTTRLLAQKVDKVLVGFEGCSHAYPDPSKVVVTGTPVRGGFSCFTKASARKALGIAEEERMVLSVWGSLGAGYMNETMLQMIPLLPLKPEFRLIHATGARYYKQFMEKLTAAAPDYAQRGVEVREYIHDMPQVMAAADLVMCRAGASTLSELTYIGKPSILVPSPNVTNNHQEKNARVLERAGGAKVLLEGQFSAEDLLSTLRTVLCDGSTLSAMSAGTASLAYSDAADKIAGVILSLADTASV